MDQLAIHRIAEAAQVDALLVDQRSDPSFVFAPADPLLMQYARNWSLSEPYRIAAPARSETPEEFATGGSWRGPSLPLEAVGDGAGAVIRMRTPELPDFLQR